MAKDLAAKTKGVALQDQQDWRKIRITLSSRNVKNLETGTVASDYHYLIITRDHSHIVM